MTINPSDYPALPVELFEYAINWQAHDGKGCPVAPDRYVKTMYSNGFTASMVRVAQAWEVWTGGRNWWIKPDDDRLYIIAYCVI